MKKKILLFEPDGLLKNTFLDQVSLNKDFEINEASDLKAIQYQLNKSSFDLIIMGTDKKAYSLCSIGQFIKDKSIIWYGNKISNFIRLFLWNSGFRKRNFE